jgi:hypothetical protein
VKVNELECNIEKLWFSVSARRIVRILRGCQCVICLSFPLEQNKTASQDNSSEKALTVEFNAKYVDLCKKKE